MKICPSDPMLNDSAPPRPNRQLEWTAVLSRCGPCLLALAALMCGVSCAAALPGGTSGSKTTEQTTGNSPTAPSTLEPPLPPLGDRPEKAEAPVVPFSETRPAITETLQRTMDMLAECRAEKARLEEQVAKLTEELQEKDRKIADLTVSLEGGQNRVAELQEALDRWKQDVLGFRDEMRTAEEAELQVLEDIMGLLKSFKKETDQERDDESKP